MGIHANKKRVIHLENDKYLKNDQTIFEKDCLPKLTSSNQLLAFKHKGFWACMDTIREKKELNEIWNSKRKAWKVWNE